MNTSYKKSNFGSAFLFLSKEKKEALSVIYAFCRIVDDIVDEQHPNAQDELDFWKKELDSVFSAATPQTKLGKDLQKQVPLFNLTKKNFLLLIEGMEMDLHQRSYKTFDELKEYFYRVAGVVGLMCCEVFGAKGDDARNYAITLGNAVQMTNIIRDIYEDAEIGRIYIPSEDLQKFDITPKDIKNKCMARLAPLLKMEGEKAKQLFKTAKESFPSEYKSALKPAVIMGAVYEAILDKIAAKKYKFNKKVRLSKLKKISVLLKALIK
ncbi:phytoene/squalene synthase family protein [Elusimicrobium minutum]|nr:squalene/phytoene synthase family protein [Elusimicrobium minutum]